MDTIYSVCDTKGNFQFLSDFLALKGEFFRFISKVTLKDGCFYLIYQFLCEEKNKRLGKKGKLFNTCRFAFVGGN